MVDVLDWAGADAVEAEELAVVPGLDEVFALADIKQFATSRRLRPRRRRLRADRRDDPVALAARRARLVHGPRVRHAAPADASSRGRCCSRCLGHARSPATSVFGGDPPVLRPPRRRARAAHRRRHHERAARREPRAARRRRGAAHVHVPLAVRLPRRRGDREPHPARPTLDHPWLDAVEGDAVGAPRRRSPTRSRRCRCSTAELAERRAHRRRRARRSFAKDLYGDLDVVGAALARRAVPRRRGRRRARALGAAAVHRARRRAARPHRRRAVRVGRSAPARARCCPTASCGARSAGARFVGDRLDVEFV